MIQEDFESILVPEHNGKQNPYESYTNNYQKHIVAAMARNKFVLMISLVCLLSLISARCSLQFYQYYDRRK